MRRVAFAIFCVAVLLALTLATPPQAGTPVSEVEIRITDHAPGIADFSELKVGLKSLSLHARGQPRNAGWHELVRELQPVDIVPLKNGRYEARGTARLPAGRYDAVRIRFASLQGALRSGEAPVLSARDTTVAANVELRASSRTPLVIDLYAENQTDHEPLRYVVKVKDVRVGQVQSQ